MEIKNNNVFSTFLLLFFLLTPYLQAQNIKRYEIAYKNVVEELKKEGIEDACKKLCPNNTDIYGIKIYDEIFKIEKGSHYFNWINIDNPSTLQNRQKSKKLTKLSNKYNKVAWLDIKEHEGKYNLVTSCEFKGPSNVIHFGKWFWDFSSKIKQMKFLSYKLF